MQSRIRAARKSAKERAAKWMLRVPKTSRADISDMLREIDRDPIAIFLGIGRPG